MCTVNKAAVCSVISKPKAHSLNCHYSIFISSEHEHVFFLLICGRKKKKYNKRRWHSGPAVLAFEWFTVGCGPPLTEVWQASEQKMRLCAPLISCAESRRKNKHRAARNNVALRGSQLIVLILLLPACHVPSAAWMSRLSQLWAIYFHIKQIHIRTLCFDPQMFSVGFHTLSWTYSSLMMSQHEHSQYLYCKDCFNCNDIHVRNSCFTCQNYWPITVNKNVSGTNYFCFS